MSNILGKNKGHGRKEKQNETIRETWYVCDPGAGGGGAEEWEGRLGKSKFKKEIVWSVAVHYALIFSMFYSRHLIKLNFSSFFWLWDFLY